MRKLAIVVPFTPAAVAQERPDHSAEVRQALERLPIAPGIREGEVWFRRGPGAPDVTLRRTGATGEVR